MGRDAQILIILIAFPVLLTAMIALSVWYASRRATVRCPVCGRRIPKDAVTDSGIDCHHCRAARMDVPQAVARLSRSRPAVPVRSNSRQQLGYVCGMDMTIALVASAKSHPS